MSFSQDSAPPPLLELPGRSDAGDDDAAVRSALHYAVGKICREEEEEEVEGAKMSSQAVAALTELVYQYSTTSLASDLVNFSQHAGRKTVTVDDVKLVARKDASLLKQINRFCDRKGFRSAAGKNKSSARDASKKSRERQDSRGKTADAMEDVDKSSGKRKKIVSSKDLRRRELLDQINASSSSSSSSGSSDDGLTSVRAKPKESQAKSTIDEDSDSESDSDSNGMVIDLASVD